MNEFIELGIRQNKWFWMHCVGGVFFAVVLSILQPHTPKSEIFTQIMFIALLWEIGEVGWEGGITKVSIVYGSQRRWVYDSLGDMLGALTTAGIILLIL